MFQITDFKFGRTTAPNVVALPRGSVGELINIQVRRHVYVFTPFFFFAAFSRSDMSTIYRRYVNVVYRLIKI